MDFETVSTQDPPLLDLSSLEAKWTSTPEPMSRMNGKIPSTDSDANDGGISKICLASLAPDSDSSSSSDSITSRTERFEPIAIVGMGCRFSGSVTKPSELWELLVDGRDGQGDMPTTRFNNSGFYHPDKEAPGSIHTLGGYFLQNDPRAFDNAFFGINSLEATYMDPQQRQLLEVVYECFEDSGVKNFSGSNTGCFVANFTNDYANMQNKDPDAFHRYSATGFGNTIMANRITHVFNLLGPSLVVDTACSSSIYALHLACQALISGDCNSALVAGANLIQSPELHLAMVKAGVLSGSSKSQTFDTAADGYGRGEGIAVLYIKKLTDAIRDKDPIRAVIRGTAVNSNGATPGITLPSASGQESVILKAYERAGLSPADTTYVESHGTGTSVGDPIEVDAISRVFCQKTAQSALIGSIKPSIGHTEAVSGIASIIKAVMILESGMIPATIGINKINPNLKLEERNITIVTSLTRWPTEATPRISVNSFGYGGANAHCILDAVSLHLPPHDSSFVLPDDQVSYILPVSAKSSPALDRRILQLISVSSPLSDVAYTLGVRREHFSHRSFLLTDSISEATIDAARSNSMHKKKILPICFVFTGQGAQWARMGAELFARYQIYRNVIRMLDESLRTIRNSSEFTIEEVLYTLEAGEIIDLAQYAQPVCTAVQIALVDLLRAWGITPSKVIGHSSGEIAAAYAAGYLSRQEAVGVAYYRGKAATNIVQRGAMIAVGTGRDQAQGLIHTMGKTDSIKVACINSSESVTLSGDYNPVLDMLNALEEQGIFVRLLKTNGKAYHSHHMADVSKSYGHSLSFLRESEPSFATSDKIDCHMVSSVTTKSLDQKTARSPDYWQKNLEQPVYFEDALKELVAEEALLLIEIGPHPALAQPVRSILSYANVKDSIYLSTLARKKNGEHLLLSLAGSIFTFGYDIDFQAVNALPEKDGMMTRKPIFDRTLPSYPWDHSTLLWKESSLSKDFRHRKFPRHDILGSQLIGSNGGIPTWRTEINCKKLPWLADHQIEDMIVFPAAGYVAMGIEAFRQVLLNNDNVPFNALTERGMVLRRVKFVSMLSIPRETETVEILTTISPPKLSSTRDPRSWWQFTVTSSIEGRRTVHATGDISVNVTSTMKRFPTDEDILERRSSSFWYKQLASRGLNFGARFQTLQDIYTDRNNTEAICVSTSNLQSGDPRTEYSTYPLHPTAIDAVLQTGLIASTKGLQDMTNGYLPSEIGYLEIADVWTTMKSADCNIHAKTVKSGFFNMEMSADLCDSTGRILLYMEKVKVVRFGSKLLEGLSTGRTPAMRMIWKPDMLFLDAGNSDQFIAYLAQQPAIANLHLSETRMRLCHVIDLYSHKRPGLKVLEVSDIENSTFGAEVGFWVSQDSNTGKIETYTRARIVQQPQGNLKLSNFQTVDNDGDKEVNESPHSYDLVLLSSSATNVVEQVNFLRNRYSNAISIATISPIRLTTPLIASCGAPLTIPSSKDSEEISIWTSLESKPRSKTPTYIIHGSAQTQLDFYLESLLNQDTMDSVTSCSLEEAASLDFTEGSAIIFTAELEQSVLAELKPSTLDIINRIGTRASVLFWITGGNTLAAEDPTRSLVLGLARSFMIENPNSKWCVLGLDNVSCRLDQTGQNVVTLLSHLAQAQNPDLEYLQSQGLLYVSRLNHVKTHNDRFDMITQRKTVSLNCGQVGLARLAISQPGKFESLHFEQRELDDTLFLEGSLKIKTAAVSINARDYYALSNKIDTKNSTCALEFCGTVLESKDPNYQPGDRVLAMAPSYHGTIEIVPAWACIKLSSSEEFDKFCTVPIAFSTALYALKYRANLQSGECILIHSACSGVGLAAVQIAQNLGASVFATVGTLAQKRHLVETFDIPEEQIFNSREGGFINDILKLTNGLGVDVILNSLTHDLSHENAACLAEFGRFVETFKRDILEYGSGLDLTVFDKSTTFTAFDLTDFYHSRSVASNRVWTKLLAESVDLVRRGEVKAIGPRMTFAATDIVPAFQYCGDANRIGEVVVQFRDDLSMKVLPSPFLTKFMPDKTYILVGGLGGLGRRITRWMYNQGARSFAFIGPSGDSKPTSKALISDLDKLGAQTTVVRGSVANPDDVRTLLNSIPSTLGGIIHTAMSVHACLLKDATVDMWKNGIEQKVQGCWVLHNALQETNQDNLDFFLLLSSISGTVGVATEGNYCAANAFLDTFARYRRQHGLTGTSLGLGMISDIGFMSEHSNVEEMMLRQGVQPYTEQEMLQFIDMSLTPPLPREGLPSPARMGAAPHEDAHFVIGLEMAGFERLHQRGYSRVMQAANDPRYSIIFRHLAKTAKADAKENSLITEGERGNNALSEIKGLISEIKTSKWSVDEPLPAELFDLLLPEVAKIFSGLLQIDVEQLKKPETILVSGGMDSMLAPEARADLLHSFKVDIPFAVVMDPNLTTYSLTNFIGQALIKAALEGTSRG